MLLLTSSTSSQEEGEAEHDKMLGVASVVSGAAYFWFDLRRGTLWRTWDAKVYRERNEKNISYPKGRTRGKDADLGQCDVASDLRKMTP